MSSIKVTLPHVSGVYKITNPEGKIYIGASNNVNKRIDSAYRRLNKNRIRLINQSILDYGYENHTFELVEQCPVSDLNERERYYQEYFNTLHPNGLNKNLVACKGKKQVASEETLTLIRDSKTGLVAWNKGIPTSESTKKTIQDRYCPLKRTRSKIILDTRTGIFYYCLREASEALNMPQSTLLNNLNAPNPNASVNKTHFIIT